jgi:hypothetical protein
MLNEKSVARRVALRRAAVVAGRLSPMWRRLFASIATISLLLFVLSGILWIRGFFVGDVFWERVSDAGAGQVVQKTIQVVDGRVIYNQYAEAITPQQAAGFGALLVSLWKHETIPSFALRSFHSTVPWHWFGFGRMSAVRAPAKFTVPPRPNGWYAGVRLLAVMAVTAVPPGLWLFQFIRRRRRHMPGCCPQCGYDMRATPDRCPECGTALGEKALVQ